MVWIGFLSVFNLEAQTNDRSAKLEFHYQGTAAAS